MSEIQKNKIEALRLSHELGGHQTISDMIDSAKLIDAYLSGYVVPDKIVTGNSGDLKAYSNVVESDNSITKGHNPPATSLEFKEVKSKYGDPEEDSCEYPDVEKIDCPKCEKEFYINSYDFGKQRAYCPFCKTLSILKI